eukprot:TRINITY_DN2065_c1_g1_i1.p1 TRINITY_DN2065_c1_g1~~TRINITY_DN2065_c1_g1_i1.p1  ORF type:complete len:233 (-),score=57.99 TRINITY_DN2065_c1_g1_i1:28-726(-)
MPATTTRDERTEKLTSFLRECLLFGCLKGFKHFTVYPRGREELLVHVISRPLTSSTAQIQRKQDIDSHDGDDVVFLIGAYARYKCPYVWVRSKHTTLPNGRPVPTKDVPLDLSSTSSWKLDGNVHLWDIIAEIIPMAFETPIINPFEVSRSYKYTSASMFDSLSCGSLSHFLRKVYLTTNFPYADKIYNDLQYMLESHYNLLNTSFSYSPSNTPSSSSSPSPSTSTAIHTLP